MVKLLNTKLEYGRLSVKFMGAKIFNDLSLSLQIRKQSFDKSFKSNLKSYFSMQLIFPGIID